MGTPAADTMEGDHFSRAWRRLSSPACYRASSHSFRTGFGKQRPPAQMRTVRSAGGDEVRLSYEAGFFGRDYTEVTLKGPTCCQHTVVFWHQGPSWFDDPKLEWLDNQHLQISYHSRPDDPQHCDQHLRDITIVCKPSPLGSGPPAEHDAQPTSTGHP
jgi:hypothetical protein